MGGMSRTMHRRRSNKLNFIARLVPAVRRPCAVLEYFFAASFGSRYLGQAWKKGSLGSGLLSREPFARSTRNIWPASVRRARRSSLAGHFAAHRRPLRDWLKNYLDQSLSWSVLRGRSVNLKNASASCRTILQNRFHIVMRIRGKGKDSQGRIVDGTGTTEAHEFANVEGQTQT